MDHDLYTEKVANKGAPVNNIWGFIDGTLQHVCWLGVDQREFFSGHKRKHGLKFQHIMLPNGIVCHSYGPFPRRRHDASLYGVSGVDTHLSQICSRNGTQLAIYGDQAYPLHPWLLTPYPGDNLSEQQQHFNKSMSPLRTAVEWGFTKLITYFTFVNFYTNLKMHLQPIGHYFQTAMLLVNCHMCCYGSEVATYFELPLPPLELYLQWWRPPSPPTCTRYSCSLCQSHRHKHSLMWSVDLSLVYDRRLHNSLLSLTKSLFHKLLNLFNQHCCKPQAGVIVTYKININVLTWNKSCSLCGNLA